MTQPKLLKRAKASMLWGLAGFSVLQVGLALAIAWWLPELRDPEYGVRSKLLARRLKTSPDRVLTVLMLGSSRTTVGFAANRLEPSLADRLGRPVVVFNFGLTGSGPLLEQLTLRRLLADGMRPDLLLLEVLPPLLAGQEAHERDRIAPGRLRHDELPILEKYGSPSPGLAEEWWQRQPCPWYEHRFGILSRTLPSLLPLQSRIDWLYTIDRSGAAAPLKRAPPAPDRNAAKRALDEYARYFNNFRLPGVSTQALHDLLALCRSEGVRTAMVLMPEGSEFRNCYPRPALALIDNYLEDLSREFAISTVDARTWAPDTDFSDAHHLLPFGARRFTDRLGRDVLLPMLRARSEIVQK